MSSLSSKGTKLLGQSDILQSILYYWEYIGHKCWDQKNVQLNLVRLKLEQTLKEDTNDSDIQIDHWS